MDVIKKSIKLEFSDFFRFQLGILKRRFGFFLVMLGFCFLCLVLNFFLSSNDWYKTPAEFFPVFILLLLPCFVVFTTYNASKKHFENDIFLKKEHTYLINSQGIEVTSENSNLKFEWHELFKKDILKKEIILYLAPGKALIIPKSFFSDHEWEKLASLVREKVVSKERNNLFSFRNIVRTVSVLIVLCFVLDAILNGTSDYQKHLEKGIKMESAGDYDAAIKEFNEAIRVNHGSVPAFYHRAYCRGALDDFEGQLYDSKEAIELDSNFANAYLLRAYAKWELNDSVGCCADLTKALALGSKEAGKSLEIYCK